MSHRPTFANHLKCLGRTVFRDNRIDGMCLENTCQQLCILSMSLPPNGPLPKLFPTVSTRPPCPRFHLAPSQRSSPQAISHGFPSVSLLPKLSVHPVNASISLLPNRALPKLFPTVSPPLLHPLHPPCRRFRLAPSQQSSPQAISHSFPFVPSVHPVVAPVSLLPNKALPKLFPTASRPSTHLAAFQRGFPQAISHCFPSVHPVVASVSLLPNEALHKLFPTLSPPSALSSSISLLPAPSTLSSFPSRLPKGALPKLFPMHSCPSVHPVDASIWLLPNGALPKLFPTVSPPSISVHPVVASVSLLPSGPLPKLFPTLSRPSTLWTLPSRSFPTELSPSYFPRFPPPSTLSLFCIFFQRSSPQAISHGFLSVCLPSLVPSNPFPSLLFPLPPSPFPLHSFLARPALLSRSRSRWRKLNENPSIGDAFGKNEAPVWLQDAKCSRLCFMVSGSLEFLVHSLALLTISQLSSWPHHLAVGSLWINTSPRSVWSDPIPPEPKICPQSPRQPLSLSSQPRSPASSPPCKDDWP